MPYLDYDQEQEELETAMEEIQRDVDALQLENQLFDRYLTVSDHSCCTFQRKANN